MYRKFAPHSLEMNLHILLQKCGISKTQWKNRKTDWIHSRRSFDVLNTLANAYKAKEKQRITEIKKEIKKKFNKTDWVSKKIVTAERNEFHLLWEILQTQWNKWRKTSKHFIRNEKRLHFNFASQRLSMPVFPFNDGHTNRYTAMTNKVFLSSWRTGPSVTSFRSFFISHWIAVQLKRNRITNQIKIDATWKCEMRNVQSWFKMKNKRKQQHQIYNKQ